MVIIWNRMAILITSVRGNRSDGREEEEGRIVVNRREESVDSDDACSVGQDTDNNRKGEEKTVVMMECENGEDRDDAREGEGRIYTQICILERIVILTGERKNDKYNKDNNKSANTTKEGKAVMMKARTDGEDSDDGKGGVESSNSDDRAICTRDVNNKLSTSTMRTAAASDQVISLKIAAGDSPAPPFVGGRRE